MRIAVLADIHGNMPAFEAALAHVKSQSPDLLVIAGDVVNGGPDSADCWQLAKSTCAPIVRGNHEVYVGRYGTQAMPAAWKTERFAPVKWSASQFSNAERAALLELPNEWVSPNAPELFLCHSSVRSDSDSIAPYTSEADLDSMFPGITAALIVRAHNHAPGVRNWRKGTIVTTGSVGLTLDGIPTAQYVLLTRSSGGWRIEHQSVEYDRRRALERFHDTGYLEHGGPMARLFYREAATAAFQIVPFLRRFSADLNSGEIELKAAVDRFLAE